MQSDLPNNCSNTIFESPDEHHVPGLEGENVQNVVDFQIPQLLFLVVNRWNVLRDPIFDPGETCPARKAWHNLRHRCDLSFENRQNDC